MPRQQYLFQQRDLDSSLRGRQASIAEKIDEVSEQQFLISSDEELINLVLHEFEIEPLQIYEEDRQMQQRETKVDVSRDRNRVFSPGTSGPFLIPGTQLDVTFPFSGEPWLFNMHTNPSSSMLPHAAVNGATGGEPGQVCISVSLPHDADPQRFKTEVDKELRQLRQHVDWSRSQVLAYNQSLEQHAQNAISHRRQRLAKHGNLAEIMDIPVKPKEGTPSVEPVTIEPRRPPTLPPVPKGGVKPEPGIAPEVYEDILNRIRHQCRTFEHTPAAAAKHGEEELRDFVLAMLNASYEGKASGETFRKSGKTDIRIEVENRSAFVGECKLWSGPTAVGAAIGQLLSYLTWRDSKAALIVFNTRNKDFSKILEAVPAALKAHPLYIRDLDCHENGEWRVLMRSEEDEGRRVTVQVMVYDLYTAKQSNRD